jgi:hypothetical protein
VQQTVVLEIRAFAGVDSYHILFWYDGLSAEIIVHLNWKKTNVKQNSLLSQWWSCHVMSSNEAVSDSCKQWVST